MHFVIHEPTISLYAPIVLASIVAGIIAAVLLMKRAGAKPQTLGLTAVLTFVSILMFSFMLSYLITGDIRKVSFVGAGGALGLIFGATASVIIHRDHVKESFAAWIVAAPLMYGLSKLACHVTGCCYGIKYDGPMYVIYPDAENAPYFPVQLAEVVVFLLIFAVGIVIFRKKSYLTAAGVALGLSAAAKICLDYLRESHGTAIVTWYQILVAVITAAGYIVIAIIKKKYDNSPLEKERG